MDKKISQLSAIVLAGGQSSRMGQDKALIPIAGVPMVRRVCLAALDCVTTVYVVAQDDCYQSLLPTRCYLIEEQPELARSGPLVGFMQGLAAIETEWVLLLACDLPRLTGDVLQQWCEQLNGVSPATVALLPRSTQGWEPLCGFYRRSNLDSLSDFVTAGGRSFQPWLAEQQVAILVVDEQLLLNCNTPIDLEQISSGMLSDSETHR
jgi:molybdenum cofactor guanylyltransferase